MKKIGLILILIIILPIAFLLVNELGKLNENEQVLEQIYNNQLQAILFSVNQYSCLLYTSPSPRDRTRSRMPSSA